MAQVEPEPPDGVLAEGWTPRRPAGTGGLGTAGYCDLGYRTAAGGPDAPGAASQAGTGTPAAICRAGGGPGGSFGAD